MAAEHWHLDKKVPLALIIGLLTQTAAMVWWTSKLDSRVLRLEELIAVQATANDRVVRLESAKDDVARRLDRIEIKLDRLIETRMGGLQ